MDGRREADVCLEACSKERVGGPPSVEGCPGQPDPDNRYSCQWPARAVSEGRQAGGSCNCCASSDGRREGRKRTETGSGGASVVKESNSKLREAVRHSELRRADWSAAKLCCMQGTQQAAPSATQSRFSNDSTRLSAECTRQTLHTSLECSELSCTHCALRN